MAPKYVSVQGKYPVRDLNVLDLSGVSKTNSHVLVLSGVSKKILMYALGSFTESYLCSARLKCF